jgi:hypothetical protein
MDRVMVTLYIGRRDKTAIEKLAVKRGEAQAETHRTMLAYAQQHMPPKWKPAPIDSKGKK